MGKPKLKPANALLEIHLRELGCFFIAEHKFHNKRKWRLDYVCGPDAAFFCSSKRFAVEIEGGVYTQGRHTRGRGFEADLQKYNMATAMGWTVFRFSTGQVLRGEAREFLKAWLRPAKG